MKDGKRMVPPSSSPKRVVKNGNRGNQNSTPNKAVKTNPAPRPPARDN